ncbi:MAG: uridine kinase [Legionellales bacterium]|nr:uridine kinase [Legionellales bacterium]|tara:strand:- start:17 stop:670 length:654 start_codon:yes stop_codon:yes gene_type:complete
MNTNDEGHSIIVGVAGPSGSGKTLFVNNLKEQLAKNHSVVVIREDNYYHDQSNVAIEEREKVNYDHPDALEHSLLIEHLKMLQNKKAVQGPNYLFHTHTRATETRQIDPAEIIICDGILLLADVNVRKILDVTAFIDAPLDICLVRRLQRDLAERGRSIAKTLNQYTETVRPMYLEFIEPTKEHVDLVVTGGGKNWNAIHQFQTLILERLNSKVSNG